MGTVRTDKSIRLKDCVTLMDFAAEMGVEPATVRGYKVRGELPEPVGFVGRIPVWTRAQMKRYVKQRPGQGFRRDLVGGGENG